MPELAATAQGFLADGRYKDETDVLRRAVGELKRSEDDLAEIEAGVTDEAAGLMEPARDVIQRAHAQLKGVWE
ncbi:MAG TPA: hypothetical protein PKC18_10920 [Lacipirellulaceae bacterium]|nr:hypothetical protein [Lacipirellulaceae bacterium]